MGKDQQKKPMDFWRYRARIFSGAAGALATRHHFPLGPQCSRTTRTTYIVDGPRIHIHQLSLTLARLLGYCYFKFTECWWIP